MIVVHPYTYTISNELCKGSYLQLNLNCLTILLIFSKRWTSVCGRRTEWAIT